MEDLTKSQIVLLTLFVSFVTSIATGIVTVTLMDQAPEGVIQPINRVVEKTVERVVPTNANQTIVKEQIVKEQEQLVISAIDRNMQSVVEFRSVHAATSTPSTGLGVIVSKEGLVVTDSALVANTESIRASYGGRMFSVQRLPVASNEPYAFVRLTPDTKEEQATSTQKTEPIPFQPISLADASTLKLGQTAITLGGAGGETAFIGIISRINRNTADPERKTIAWLETNIELGTESSGAPLITIDGTLAGVNIIRPTEHFAVPVSEIQNTLAHIEEVVASDSAISLESGIDKLANLLIAFEAHRKASSTKSTSTTQTAE